MVQKACSSDINGQPAMPLWWCPLESDSGTTRYTPSIAPASRIARNIRKTDVLLMRILMHTRSIRRYFQNVPTHFSCSAFSGIVFSPNKVYGWLYRLTVRTEASQALNRGSIPRRVTKRHKTSPAGGFVRLGGRSDVAPATASRGREHLVLCEDLEHNT